MALFSPLSGNKKKKKRFRLKVEECLLSMGNRLEGKPERLEGSRCNGSSMSAHVNATVNFSAKLICKNNLKSFAYVYTADITLNTLLHMDEAVFETAGVWHCKCVAFKTRMLMEKL